MTTTSWILLGVLATLMTVVATMMIVQTRTKQDREDVIDETVARLTYG
jgi:hypothetical protein